MSAETSTWRKVTEKGADTNSALRVMFLLNASNNFWWIFVVLCATIKLLSDWQGTSPARRSWQIQTLRCIETGQLIFYACLADVSFRICGDIIALTILLRDLHGKLWTNVFRVFPVGGSWTGCKVAGPAPVQATSMTKFSITRTCWCAFATFKSLRLTCLQSTVSDGGIGRNVVFGLAGGQEWAIVCLRFQVFFKGPSRTFQVAMAQCWIIQSVQKKVGRLFTWP